jgi:hypothetical protein
MQDPPDHARLLRSGRGYRQEWWTSIRKKSREACERAYATRSARERSARRVLPMNENRDVSRARRMMDGGWHARSGARHNENVTSAYELRI